MSFTMLLQHQMNVIMMLTHRVNQLMNATAWVWAWCHKLFETAPHCYIAKCLFAEVCVQRTYHKTRMKNKYNKISKKAPLQIDTYKVMCLQYDIQCQLHFLIICYSFQGKGEPTQWLAAAVRPLLQLWKRRHNSNITSRGEKQWGQQGWAGVPASASLRDIPGDLSKLIAPAYYN